MGLSLETVNSQLRAAGVRVTIAARGDRLSLVATVPDRAGGKKPKQTRISLGYRSNDLGIKQARLRANKLPHRIGGWGFQ
jgi:hypothetical protein